MTTIQHAKELLALFGGDKEKALHCVQLILDALVQRDREDIEIYYGHVKDEIETA